MSHAPHRRHRVLRTFIYAVSWAELLGRLRLGLPRESSTSALQFPTRRTALYDGRLRPAINDATWHPALPFRVARADV